MDKYIQKILIPIDGSESSKRALEFGIAIAKAANAKVTVLEVIEDFGPLPGYYDAAPPGKDRVKWISEQRFEKVHTILDDSSIQWTRTIKEGYAADEILKVSEDGKFDLIVIGSRGMGAVGRFLVGSVSDRVVHHAHCSVTVVR
ncbi:MAG: universal stress protein [Leptospiraceae bacterium]|jgi:nucleotide-binding universal stress UspA family protein|nr:universal stress protein [Leptospiraceae bacterium]MCZ8345874.1 universal stress protein [Leptospiraceae bacterium]PJE01074.1 MAG: universal stress protein UspA [Leptospira sp.]